MTTMDEPTDLIVPSQDIPISKNQLKRQKKHELWQQGRAERRKSEKEKRKLKRKELAQERVEKGETFVDPRRYNLMSTSSNKFKIVIDLDFEDLMTPHEISKAVQQVARIYAANRHSDHPSQLYLTSLKGKILDRFAIVNRGYTNWDINLTDKNFLDTFSDPNLSQVENKEKFIYLTADSDETLPSVDELITNYSNKIFIIGGLVDHNRYKNLCFNRAQEHGIKTAKLPITNHVRLNQRQILSTVTVFEILLDAFASKKTWADILVSRIPKRKLAQFPTDDT